LEWEFDQNGNDRLDVYQSDGRGGPEIAAALAAASAGNLTDRDVIALRHRMPLLWSLSYAVPAGSRSLFLQEGGGSLVATPTGTTSPVHVYRIGLAPTGTPNPADEYFIVTGRVPFSYFPGVVSTLLEICKLPDLDQPPAASCWSASRPALEYEHDAQVPSLPHVVSHARAAFLGIHVRDPLTPIVVVAFQNEEALGWVVAHELLHSLDLSDVDKPNNVMHWNFAAVSLQQPYPYSVRFQSLRTVETGTPLPTGEEERQWLEIKRN
jgi:hypothetical protein